MYCYVFAAHALLVFSDLQVVTAGDFGDIAPIPKFSVQSSLGFLGCFRENLRSWSWGC